MYMYIMPRVQQGWVQESAARRARHVSTQLASSVSTGHGGFQRTCLLPGAVMIMPDVPICDALPAGFPPKDKGPYASYPEYSRENFPGSLFPSRRARPGLGPHRSHGGFRRWVPERT